MILPHPPHQKYFFWVFHLPPSPPKKRLSTPPTTPPAPPKKKVKSPSRNILFCAQSTKKNISGVADGGGSHCLQVIIYKYSNKSKKCSKHRLLKQILCFQNKNPKICIKKVSKKFRNSKKYQKYQLGTVC